MMLYDVVMMNMIYHVVCIVSTMSKDATRCTWCSMMNLDVGNVFIAFQGICRILWRFTPINAMWCSYCRYVCDDHIWKVPFSTSTYIRFISLLQSGITLPSYGKQCVSSDKIASNSFPSILFKNILQRKKIFIVKLSQTRTTYIPFI